MIFVGLICCFVFRVSLPFIETIFFFIFYTLVVSSFFYYCFHFFLSIFYSIIFKFLCLFQFIVQFLLDACLTISYDCFVAFLVCTESFSKFYFKLPAGISSISSLLWFINDSASCYVSSVEFPVKSVFVLTFKIVFF